MQPELVTALDALANEMEGCEQLAELLVQQREALLSSDQKQMTAAAEAAVQHVEHLRTLAAARRQALLSLSAALELTTHELSLDAIAAALPPPERQTWCEMSTRATAAAHRAADLNDLNHEIAQDGLAYTQSALRLLSGELPELSPYRDARRGGSGPRRSIPVVMDKSA